MNKSTHLETFFKKGTQNGCNFLKNHYNKKRGHHKSSGERLMTQTNWWCVTDTVKVKLNTPPLHLASGYTAMFPDSDRSRNLRAEQGAFVL